MAKRKKILTPEQAIIAKCVECSGGQKKEVENCPILGCPLWPYRNGIERKEMPVDSSIWNEEIELDDE